MKPSIDDIIASDIAASSDLPALPAVDVADSDRASVEYSQHRTKLSTHRTALSEHRTGMSSRRTGMSFQRTRLSADRTLMSVIRTSLALIGFGFTIFQFFQRMQVKSLIDGGAQPARNFGLTLVVLGVIMLLAGIAYQIQFMIALRRERRTAREEGLICAKSPYPISFALVTAFLLLLIGIAAMASLVFNAGPFD